MEHSNTQFRFTKKALQDLPAKDKDYTVHDTVSRQLVLRVFPGGAKTFFRYGRINGKVKRVKIGPFPTVSVVGARKKCDAINGNVAEGKPVQTSSKGGLTFGDLWQRYWDEHAVPKKAESSRAHDKWQWDRLIAPAWKSRKVANIRKADVLELQSKIASESGQTSANRALSLVKKVFNHAIDAERIEVNPAERVKKYQERSRSRFLQGDELPRFFEALNAFDNQDVADFWRVCLLTGARQSNVLSMRWKEIDSTTNTWTIPRTKGGDSQRVPLVTQVVEILENRRNLSEFVFASHGKSGHLTRPGKAWERLLEQAGLENLTMHDLRRSLASWQVAAGVSSIHIGATLGHAPGSKATAVYARIRQDEILAAVEQGTNAILAFADAKIGDDADEPAEGGEDE